MYDHRKLFGSSEANRRDPEPDLDDPVVRDVKSLMLARPGVMNVDESGRAASIGIASTIILDALRQAAPPAAEFCGVEIPTHRVGRPYHQIWTVWPLPRPVVTSALQKRAWPDQTMHGRGRSRP